MISRKFLFLALTGFAFTACDKDKVELTQEDKLKANVWVFTADSYDGEVEAADDCDNDDTIEFKADGVVVFDANDDSACGADGSTDEEPSTGSYALQGDKLFFVASFFGGNPTITKLTDTDLWLEYSDEEQTYQDRYKAAKIVN